MHTAITSVTIITPCYNEQDTVIRFLRKLEQVIASLPYIFTVVVVDDHSTDDTFARLNSFRFGHEQLALEVISLKLNAGHQVAIYQGLLYAKALHSQYYLIMDADGEDDPAVIPELLQHADKDIVHVVRSHRRESILFRVGYAAYKAVFRLVTGTEMNFGNYSLISRAVAERAVHFGFVHFAAFLSRQQVSRCTIAADKQARLGGTSRMSFMKHMVHALRSFAEYGDATLRLFTRCFVIAAALLVVCTCMMAYCKYAVHTAIPVWLPICTIALVNIILTITGLFTACHLLLRTQKRNTRRGIILYETTTHGYPETAV